jgi:uncharacterized protein YjiK
MGQPNKHLSLHNTLRFRAWAKQTRYALYLLLLLLVSCNTQTIQAQQSADFPYNLDVPTRYFELPTALKEISGIYPDPNDATQLLAIQDERGQFFRINKKTGAVKFGNTFKPIGDFEDLVAISRDTVVVLQSKGDLYTVIFPDDSVKMKVVKNRIFPKIQRQEVDLEGLTWDATTRRLLVAVKHQNEPWDSRAILPFALLPDGTTQAQGDTNWVRLSKMQQFLTNNPAKSLQKLRKKYVDSLDLSQRRWEFAPSAIAIHPTSKNYYILAAKQHLLIILRPRSNDIVAIIRLDKTKHPQAEGICFDANGTMYLSDEGQDNLPARLWVFEPQ